MSPVFYWSRLALWRNKGILYLEWEREYAIEIISITGLFVEYLKGSVRTLDRCIVKNL